METPSFCTLKRFSGREKEGERRNNVFMIIARIVITWVVIIISMIITFLLILPYVCLEMETITAQLSL